MNCAICGKDNQPGTRYCVHCGAALTASGAATGAASTSTTTLRPVATAVPTPAPSRPAAPAPELGAAPRPAEPAPAIPVYDAEPKKAGVVILAIGLVALFAVGGYIGYKVFGGSGEVSDTLSRIDTTPAPRPAPPPSPPPPVAPTTPSPEPAATSSAAESPRPADDKAAPRNEENRVQGATPESVTPPPPVVPKPDAKAAAAKAAAAREKAAAQSQAASPAPPTAAAPKAAAPALPPPAAAAPVQDRWAQFAEELRRCQRESFLNRVVCDQRVRINYCEGYWGKVPQCPGGIANPDRGQ